MFKPAVFLAAALIATLTHAAPIDFPEDISNATSTLEARVDDGFMYYYGNSDCSGPGNGNWLGQPGSCHGLPGWSLKIISLPHGKGELLYSFPFPICAARAPFPKLRNPPHGSCPLFTDSSAQPPASPTPRTLSPTSFSFTLTPFITHLSYAQLRLRLQRRYLT